MTQCVCACCGKNEGVCVCVYVCVCVRSFVSSSFVVRLFVFLSPSFGVSQPHKARLRCLDATKVRKASELLTDRRPARSLSPCQAPYIHTTAPADVLSVTVGLNRAVQLLDVVTVGDGSCKDTAYCSCGCSRHCLMLILTLQGIWSSNFRYSLQRFCSKETLLNWKL